MVKTSGRWALKNEWKVGAKVKDFERRGRAQEPSRHAAAGRATDMGGSSSALPERRECADHAGTAHRGKNHSRNQWCENCNQCCWCPVLPSFLLSPCALNHHPRGKGGLLAPSLPRLRVRFVSSSPCPLCPPFEKKPFLPRSHRKPQQIAGQGLQGPHEDRGRNNGFSS